MANEELKVCEISLSLHFIFLKGKACRFNFDDKHRIARLSLINNDNVHVAIMSERDGFLKRLGIIGVCRYFVTLN